MNLSFTRPNQPPPPPPIFVVLASQSIGRRTLLEKLGIPFRVTVANIDEEKIVDSDPYKMLRRRAAAKAEEIVNHPRVYTLSEEGKTVIIAADSMAVMGKKTYGKAIDREDAKLILKALMDKTHVFATAMTVILTEGQKEAKRWDKLVLTKVTLRKLPTAEIDQYVAKYDFSRFAAGYAINETPWDVVTKIDGSYTNVIGLPFEELLPILRKVELLK